jgi:hypothetical protein
MANVLLISENKIKSWSALDDNVQVDDLVPFIIQAQDLHLQKSIGTLFFTRLKQGVEANDLTNDEKDLLNDYIAQMLLNYALYMAIPSLKYKLTNGSIQSPTSETATNASLDEVKWLRQTILDTAEFYDQNLRKFLIQHPGLFEEYNIPGIKGIQPSKSTAYFSGIHIPKRRRIYTEDEQNQIWGCGGCPDDQQTWG